MTGHARGSCEARGAEGARAVESRTSENLPDRRFRDRRLALLAPLAPAGTAHAQPPSSAPRFEQQILFRADRDPGYACFRFPVIVRTAGGTLLVFAEGRVLSCGDSADDLFFTGANAATSDTVLWLPMDQVSDSR
ncbi:hypothetical protein QFZ32_001815 [Streptomyces canus]|nr:hypothetical protein [Streptomyces canus]